MTFFFILIIMNLFYAGSPTFMKLAAKELTPLEIVYLRHTLALIAFLPFFLLEPQKRIHRHDFFQIVLGTFLAFTFASIFQIIGMQTSNATDGTFIMAMEPVIVIVLACFFLKEKLDSKMLMALSFAMAGFVILSTNSSNFGKSFNGRWMGNVLFLLATTAEASFPVFLKPLLKRYSPLVVAFYCLLCASFYMLPFQEKTLLYKIPHLSFETLVSIGYLGLGCSFFACLLWLVSLSKAKASLVAISWFIQPVFGCLFAFLILKESMTASIWMGGAFTLAALSLLTLKEKSLPEGRPSLASPTQTVVRIQHPLWQPRNLDQGLGTLRPFDKAQGKQAQGTARDQRPATSKNERNRKPVPKLTPSHPILWDHHRLGNRQRHVYH